MTRRHRRTVELFEFSNRSGHLYRIVRAGTHVHAQHSPARTAAGKWVTHRAPNTTTSWSYTQRLLRERNNRWWPMRNIWTPLDDPDNNDLFEKLTYGDTLDNDTRERIHTLARQIAAEMTGHPMTQGPGRWVILTNRAIMTPQVRWWPWAAQLLAQRPHARNGTRLIANVTDNDLPAVLATVGNGDLEVGSGTRDPEPTTEGAEFLAAYLNKTARSPRVPRDQLDAGVNLYLDL